MNKVNNTNEIMNKDALVNQIAHAAGCSRKEVLYILKSLSFLPYKDISKKKGKQYDL